MGEEERLASPERRVDEEISQVGEIYLELRRVDLDDADAILEFVNRFGILAAGGLAHPFHPIEQWAAGGGGGGMSHETLHDFRFGARCLADLTDAFVYLASFKDSAGGSAPAWREAGAMTGLRLEELLGEDPQRDPELKAALAARARDLRTEPEEVLVSGLTAGLAPFHYRVEHLPGPVWEVASDMTIPTYAVCCAEIHNHLLDNTHLRVCAKDDCGREFVRQRGRARAKQYRLDGVMYCSVECARAVAVRRYRLKARAQKQAGG
jgi:hypothetical protein